MKFTELPYRRPDVPALLEAYAALAQKAAAAQSGEELLALWDEHQQRDEAYSQMARLSQIRHTIDTRDEFYNAENDFYDEHNPSVGNAQLGFYRACLASPHKEALAAKYGDILLTVMELAVKGADERVLALMQEDNALTSQYQNLYAGALVEFEGQTLTLPQLGPYKQGLDREKRRLAYEAEGRWFDAHREEFDTIYTKMVENRNAQARLLGFDDYSQLSYLRMGRIGYGPKEVETYRLQVSRDIVPMVHRLQQVKFARVGLEDPKFYDLPVYFKDGNALPHGTPDQLMEGCREMYRQLSPETAEFIDFMFENQLFDLLTKPGKAPGGYMEHISGYAPFVFSNWNGTSGDVDVITHEMGHAFQAYMAQKQGLIAELFSPGMESCEIHSMSMEFLTSPWHHLFFGPDTAKYQLAHAEDSFFFLPYGCQVDEFQHIMYQQPHLTPDQRNQVWLELEKKYRPWIDFDNLPFYGRGAGWQRQLHIYECPFYYIDYCLAQTVALQFFAAFLNDKDDAWQRYLALVKKGGTESYAGLVQAAGFAVPFEDGSLAPVARQVAEWIQTHQKV
ncbi:MAG: M3 family oligoendopeptidase [Oscillospiraceae bacterium]|nr:M3 family oligoendopeptidase [Oscillospiraceae bacterium]